MLKNNSIELKDEPTILKSLAVGMSEDTILMAFNSDENGVPEYASVIPVKNLKEVIALLFNCGMEYQKEYGKDIGFGEQEG